MAGQWNEGTGSVRRQSASICCVGGCGCTAGGDQYCWNGCAVQEPESHWSVELGAQGRRESSVATARPEPAHHVAIARASVSRKPTGTGSVRATALTLSHRSPTNLWPINADAAATLAGK